MNPIINEMTKTNDISEFLSFWLENDLLSADNSAVMEQYYKSYKKNFGRYIRYYYKRQTKELMELLDSIENPNVLEIGCGCGTEALFIALQAKIEQITTVDINENRINVLNERREILEKEIGKTLPLTVLKENILNLNIEKKFNIIWMEQTFHHLEPREEIVKKLKSLIKPGGYLIISETNAWNPVAQMMLFLKRGFKTIVRHNDLLYGNERIITQLSLKQKLAKAGFIDIKHKYFRVLPNNKFTTNLSPHPLNIPLPFIYTHYNLIARA